MFNTPLEFRGLRVGGLAIHAATFFGLILLSQPRPGFAAENLLEHGDAVEHVQIFAENPEVKISLVEGNPAGGGEVKACFAVELLEDSFDRFKPCSLNKNVFIDSAKPCRIAVNAYTDSEAVLSFSGYGYGEASTSDPLMVGEGEARRVWEYHIKDSAGKDAGSANGSAGIQGPLGGWTTYETTIAPEGTAAELCWPPGMVSLNLTLWIKGAKGTKVYLSSISVEEVPTEEPAQHKK